MTEPTNIVDLCLDEKAFGRWFKNTDSWRVWFAFLRALFALPMDETDRKIYKELTGREDVPTEVFRETWLVIGRRGGKSFILALVAVFLAAFKDWTPYLQPGERGTIMVIAADRTQARVIFRYIVAMFREVPWLKTIVQHWRSESLDLDSGQGYPVSIEIHTASFRTVRGYTIVAALLDEIAFWRSDDSANPDKEILDALRPGMATVQNEAMLLAASSPYARRGVLWESYKESYGKEDPTRLVCQAPSWLTNPSLDQKFIDNEYKRDARAAAAELGAQFRTDVETFISEEALELVTMENIAEQPFVKEYKYYGFVDASGGSKDSYTLGISHREGEEAVLDVLRETEPPFDPDVITERYCLLLKSYGIHKVYGDRYGGEWPRERFRKHGVEYEVCEDSKSDLYLAFLPLVNAQRVALLDNDRLKNQLLSLERRTSRVGRDIIDHPPGSFDDLANVAAGACVGVMPMTENWNEKDFIVGNSLAAARAVFMERDIGDIDDGDFST